MTVESDLEVPSNNLLLNQPAQWTDRFRQVGDQVGDVGSPEGDRLVGTSSGRSMLNFPRQSSTQRLAPTCSYDAPLGR
jgi:hypothetical protein